MQLQDYLHYYMGCNMTHKENLGAAYILHFDVVGSAIDHGDLPVLRRLGDMTDRCMICGGYYYKLELMSKELTPEEKAEQELADKISPLIKERQELEFKRGNGVSLDKNEYIGDRLEDIEKELSRLKKKPNGE
jgi:hypothetical protein